VPSRVLRGIGLKVLASLIFSVMLALVKALNDYPLSQIVFIRSFLAIGMLCIWLAASGEFPQALGTKRLRGHLLRAVAGVASVFLNFTAFRLLPFADVTALNFLAVPLILIFSALMGREPMRGIRWAAVIGGFAGTLLMLWSHFEPAGSGQSRSLLGISATLISVCAVAVAMIQTRSLAKSEHTAAIVFYFLGLTGLVALLIYVAALVWPPNWAGAGLLQEQHWVLPSSEDLLWLGVMGASGGIGQLVMTAAFRYADASVLACFEYSAMVWALAIGILVFGEYPTALVLAGAALIIASGLVVVWCEGQVGTRLRAALRKA
jgi:drug/metabolite transporter (DMT)-like permease